MRRTRPLPAPLPGPTLTLTLAGGAHLHEFPSFRLKALHSFDPTRPGARCLRGAQAQPPPPMQVPTPYTLPLKARALYVYGRSGHGAAHDVHLALVPAAGAQVVVPLSVATEEKRRDVARLARLLQDASWQVATTMLDNWHQYSRRSTWALDADFEFAVRAIRRYGRKQAYIPPGETEIEYWETIFEFGSHFVWSGWQPPEFTRWLNRKPLETPVEATVVDQTLTVDEALVVPIPALADGFGGLPEQTTRDPFFRAGVALFGWPVPEKKRRSRKVKV